MVSIATTLDKKRKRVHSGRISFSQMAVYAINKENPKWCGKLYVIKVDGKPYFCAPERVGEADPMAIYKPCTTRVGCRLQSKFIAMMYKAGRYQVVMQKGNDELRHHTDLVRLGKTAWFTLARWN